MESPSPRSSRANPCNNCRKAHKACDGQGPPCENCVEKRFESCTYGTTPTKSPGRKKRNQSPSISDKVDIPSFNGNASVTTYRVVLGERYLVVNPSSDHQIIRSVEEDAQECKIYFNVEKKKDKSGLLNLIRDAEKEATMELPAASVRIIDPGVEQEYQDQYRPFWKQPKQYVEFIDPTFEELDNVIEYDLDAEDEVWLAQYNEKRKEEGKTPMSEDLFEELIDRLEKVAFQHESSRSLPPPEDIDVENTNCCICDDGTSDDTNQIVFCDGCEIAVHQECYGIRCIPEGQWFCTLCVHQAERAKAGETDEENIQCVLCPNSGGAFKKTIDGRWAHVKCALWIPEVSFTNLENGMKRGEICDLEKIEQERWDLACELCEFSHGACVQCKDKHCTDSFHVTCAQANKLFMEIKEKGERTIHSVCCWNHSPKNYKKRVEKEKLRREKKTGSKNKAQRPKKKFLEVYGHDTISLEEAREALGQREDQDIEQIWNHWIQKRKSRSGNPLLKRFWKSILFSNRDKPERKKERKETKKGRQRRITSENYQKLRAMRKELERFRILLELTKKREALKLKMLENQKEEFETSINPHFSIQKDILDFFEKQDKFGFFLEMVSEEEVKDYYTVIKNPIALSTMFDRVNSGLYPDMDHFWADLDLMFDNAKIYNNENTIVYKESRRLFNLKESLMAKLKIGVEEFQLEKENLMLESQKREPRKKGKRGRKAVPKLVSKSEKKSENSELGNSLVENAQVENQLENGVEKDHKQEVKVLEDEEILDFSQPQERSGLQLENSQVENQVENQVEDEEAESSPKRRRKSNGIKKPVKRGLKKEVEDVQLENQVEDKKLGKLDESSDLEDSGKKKMSLQEKLEKILSKIIKFDGKKLFMEMVDKKEVPEYYKIIKNPMAFSKMKLKLKKKKYTNMLQFKTDVETIAQNAMTFNEPATVYYKEAQKLLWKADLLFKKMEGKPQEQDTKCKTCKKSKDANKTVHCEGCDSLYHSYCLDPPLPRVPKDSWYCSTCDPTKHCTICKKDDDDAHIVLCDGCDNGFHTYCLVPKMRKVPDGRWYCEKCHPHDVCSHCDQPTEGKTVTCRQCNRECHLKCMKLTSVPRNWTCPLCLPKKKNGRDEDSDESSSDERKKRKIGEKEETESSEDEKPKKEKKKNKILSAKSKRKNK